MRLEQFYIFKKIVEEKSIKKASKSLYFTQQYCSKAMLQLEKELDVRLFEHTRTGILLTPEGEQAYQVVGEITENVDRLKEMFCVDGAEDRTEACSVNIISCPILDSYVNFVVKNLFIYFPEAPVNEKQVSRNILKTILTSSGDTDADIILTNMTAGYEKRICKKIRTNYSCYFLYEDELRVQLPKDSPYADYDVLPLDILVNIPMMLFDPDSNGENDFEQMLRSNGHPLKYVSRTSNLDTCSQIALNSGRGCLVGYPSVELRPLANCVYIPIEHGYHLQQLMFIKKHHENRSFVKAFFENMEQLFDVRKIF